MPPEVPEQGPEQSTPYIDPNIFDSLLQSVHGAPPSDVSPQATSNPNAAVPEANQNLTIDLAVPTQTPLERLNEYLTRDFGKLDLDGNGQVTTKELEAKHEWLSNKDESAMLTWLEKNMSSMEKLGDKSDGFSWQDLTRLNDVHGHGTGGLGFALRNQPWMITAGSSFAAVTVVDHFMKLGLSMKQTAGLTAAVFAGNAALSAGWYYVFDKPKLDGAITDLNAMPEPEVVAPPVQEQATVQPEAPPHEAPQPEQPSSGYIPGSLLDSVLGGH